VLLLLPGLVDWLAYESTKDHRNRGDQRASESLPRQQPQRRFSDPKGPSRLGDHASHGRWSIQRV